MTWETLEVSICGQITNKMTLVRRSFLKFAGVLSLGTLGAGLIALLFTRLSLIERIFYRIEGLFKQPIKLPPDSERAEVKLPPKGETISVEVALNSRCTSDYDGNPRKAHWGIFDIAKKLTDYQIKKILDLVKIPRFTDRRVEIQSDRNMLTFMIEGSASGILRDWMMVESGMQQQAVGLVCAALGVGMVFRNLGKDGTPISDTNLGTVRFRLDAMKPTYDSSFWAGLPPTGRKPWTKGNLPDPLREGNKPLIRALTSLQIHNKASTQGTKESVSQLLWAARGRTPHLYRSTPWGMTIPTWGGFQNISSVYFISNKKLYKYINWAHNRPTHSLSEVGEIDDKLINKLSRLFSLHEEFIVLGKNEDFGRALWEVGYQLLNLLLQASVLEIGYKAALLDEKQKRVLGDVGVNNPVALFAI